VQEDAAYDLANGFALQCALRPDEARGGRVLRVGTACGLDVTAAGSLRAWLVALQEDEVGAAQEERAGGRVLVESAPGALAPGRWSRVAVRYDRRVLALLVDGVTVASAEESAPVWKVDGPLVLSDERQPFAGSLDSLVISAVTAAEEVLLPEGAAFAAGAPAEILFAPGGGLDRAVHAAPVALALELDDGRRRSVAVSLYGTVE
jgi:hypothetical protein